MSGRVKSNLCEMGEEDFIPPNWWGDALEHCTLEEKVQFAKFFWDHKQAETEKPVAKAAKTKKRKKQTGNPGQPLMNAVFVQLFSSSCS